MLYTGTVLVQEIPFKTRRTIQCLWAKTGLTGNIACVTFTIFPIKILSLWAVNVRTLSMYRKIPTRTKVAVCCTRSVACLARAVARLTAPPAGVAEGLLRTLFNTLSLIEKVTRLAGKAVRVIPAVFTWRWAGETDTPASVLIGALRTMSATLVPEKKVTFNTAATDLWVFCVTCFAANFTVNALSCIRVLHLPYAAQCCLADPIVKFVMSSTLGTYVAICAQFTIGYAGQAGIVTPVRIESPWAVCPTATLVEETFLSVFINSTGSAFKQLVSVALGAGGMTQDTLVLQHKLATRTGRRGFTSSKSNAEDQENDKRDEGPHGCARGLSVESEKDGKQ